MIEKVSFNKNLQFVYKPEIPRRVHLCETEADTCLDHCETTERTQNTVNPKTNPVNTLEDDLWKINLVTAEDTNEPMSIQFQEDVNSLRLAQRNNPCLRLILQWANAEKHPHQNPLTDLEIKKANAIAQGEDAVAIWGLWGKDGTYWWRAVQEVACGRKQWNTKTTCSKARTQRDNFAFQKVCVKAVRCSKRQNPVLNYCSSNIFCGSPLQGNADHVFR